MSRKIIALRGFVLISLAGTLCVNALANILPFNGKTTGEVSDQYAVYFVPAGYVFSIWSVIYFLLIAYTLYIVFGVERLGIHKQRIAKLFIMSNVLNALWMFAWHFDHIYLSVTVMVALLCTLIALYRTHEMKSAARDWKEAVLLRLPFSIYLGWISVATIANFTVAFSISGWDGWGISGSYWSAILIIVATLLGIKQTIQYRDGVFCAVLIWALIGIAAKFPSLSVITTAVWIGVPILIFCVVWSLYVRVKSPVRRPR